VNGQDANGKSETRNSKRVTRGSRLARWLSPIRKRVSRFEFRISDLARRAPWQLLLLAGCLFLLAAWLEEREARRRQAMELEQLQAETATRVKELEARAAAAVGAANQQAARTMRELAERRRKLARESEALRGHLATLREQERVRVEQVATLPSTELAKRVAARLGPGAIQIRDSGAGIGVSHKQVSADRLQATGERENGERPETPRQPPETSLTPNPGLVLSDEALRQVETAFVELDSCRAQATVKEQQLANCQEQVGAHAGALGQVNQSLQGLQEAIRLKDEILARREAEHRRELKAARGTRWGRFLRSVQYVALGVVIGVAAR